jgi:hypothetical protein
MIFEELKSKIYNNNAYYALVHIWQTLQEYSKQEDSAIIVSKSKDSSAQFERRKDYAIKIIIVLYIFPNRRCREGNG